MTYTMINKQGASNQISDHATPKNINLYGEDGIAVYLTADHDICNANDADAEIKVIGHAAYVCSAAEADRKIRSAYLTRMGIADPLDF